MSTHKRIEWICWGAAGVAVLLAAVFLLGPRLGLEAAAAELGYESRLFNMEQVHTIDIEMDDWDGFLETCTDEEYSLCNVVIDG